MPENEQAERNAAEKSTEKMVNFPRNRDIAVFFY